MTLLSINSEAVALALWNNETPWTWSQEKADFLNESGWIDVFPKDGKTVFSNAEFMGNLFFQEGKFWMKACLGSESVISYKFWKDIPSALGKIPGARLQRSPVFRGYDLIFPITTYITRLQK